MSRIVKINKRGEDGLYVKEFVYYDSIKEAEDANVKFHNNWRVAFNNNDLEEGNYVLTEEEHEVIPIIQVVHHPRCPIVRTPNGTFSPKAKKKLTSRKFANRFMFNEKRRKETRNNGCKQEYGNGGPHLIRAAFHFARHGDPVSAYKFGYIGTPWLARMSEKQIENSANQMLKRITFVRLYLKEVREYLDEAGITPVELLQRYNEKLDDNNTTYEQLDKGTKFLLSLHPDFAETLMPMILTGRSRPELPSKDESNFEEAVWDEVEVEPGKHLTGRSNGENKSTKTVDKVVHGGVLEESALEEKERGSP